MYVKLQARLKNLWEDRVEGRKTVGEFLRAVSPIVREPAILLIKWLRPKGLKVCSYVKKKYAEFKNQTLKKIGWYTKMLCTGEYPRGKQFLKLALKWGTLYHRI